MKTLRDEWFDSLPDLQLSVPFNLEEAAKVVFRVGSHSHGTYVPPDTEFGIDDVDLMVICVPPPQYKLGLREWTHADYKHGRLDVVFYDWGKWMQMLLKSNPNVLGTLWLEPDDILLFPRSGSIHPFEPFCRLLNGRSKLLSKQMHAAFIGYARGQLHKMTNHAHQGYMGEKRKQLVEKFGYDVKNASHMIRLLRMAVGAYETGEILVRRPDAQELIDIKQGKWSLASVVEEADRLFARADAACAASSLPGFSDELFIQTIMVQGYALGWGWRTLEWEQ